MRHWTRALIVLAATGAGAVAATNWPSTHAASATGPAPSVAPTAIPVAVVNGNPIPMADFERELAITVRREGRDDPFFRIHVLDSLLWTEVCRAEAVKRGVKVTEAQIDASVRADALAAVHAINTPPGSDQSAAAREAYRVGLYMSMKRDAGFTEADLRRAKRQALLLDGLKVAMRKEIPVKDAEVAAFYKANPDVLLRHAEVRVRLIKVEERALADRLLKRLKAGADFAALAREYSEDGNTYEDGGDTGFFSRDDLPMPVGFDDAAFKLKPGVVAGPLELDDGYYLLRLIELRPAHRPTLQAARKQLTDLTYEGKFGQWLHDKTRLAVVVYAPGFPPPLPTTWDSPLP